MYTWCCIPNSTALTYHHEGEITFYKAFLLKLKRAKYIFNDSRNQKSARSHFGQALRRHFFFESLWSVVCASKFRSNNLA